MSKKAVILYSGGLDSTTCMAIAGSEGFAPYAISFAYGQRHCGGAGTGKEKRPDYWGRSIIWLSSSTTARSAAAP